MNDIGFMKKACLLCDRASCGYKTGALAVKNGRTLAKAWNATLPGEKYCQKGQCDRHKLKLTKGRDPEVCCAIHAEANLIAQAAARGIKLKGADIYVTTFPCYICAKSLVQAQIGRLFYMSNYLGGDAALGLFSAAKIPVERILEEIVWAKKSPC
jgi:dCMP deaminase